MGQIPQKAKPHGTNRFQSATILPISLLNRLLPWGLAFLIVFRCSPRAFTQTPNPTARAAFRAPPYSQSRSLIGSYRGVWLSCPFFADHHEPSHKRQTPRHEPLSGRHPTPNIARPDPLGRPPWSRPRPHWPFPSALALAKAPLACPSGPCPVLALPRPCPGPGLALPWPSPWTTYAHNMCPCQLTRRSSSLQSKYAHNMCPCQLFCTSSLLRR